MNHLGAEIRELHGLVVGKLVDRLGVRHETRVRREHAVDVGPDDDFGSLQERPENGSGKVAPVAPERGLDAGGGGRDETGDDEAPAKLGGNQLLQIALALHPLHRRAERSPLDDDHLPGVDPLHLTLDAAALAQERCEQAGRPDLAIPRDHIAHRVGRRADEPYGLQHSRDVLAIAGELHAISVAGGRRQELRRKLLVPLPQLLERARNVPLGLLGERDGVQQRIRDPAAGRQHHGLARVGGGLDDVCDPAEAIRVRDARAAEFVHNPLVHILHTRSDRSSVGQTSRALVRVLDR
jgi:hypothetical protein